LKIPHLIIAYFLFWREGRLLVSGMYMIVSIATRLEQDVRKTGTKCAPRGRLVLRVDVRLARKVESMRDRALATALAVRLARVDVAEGNMKMYHS